MLTRQIPKKKAFNKNRQKPFNFWYLGWELNPHSYKSRGILSPISWAFMMLYDVFVSNIIFDILKFLSYINPHGV
jgi:hypothetical protein